MPFRPGKFIVPVTSAEPLSRTAGGNNHDPPAHQTTENLEEPGFSLDDGAQSAADRDLLRAEVLRWCLFDRSLAPSRPSDPPSKKCDPRQTVAKKKFRPLGITRTFLGILFMERDRRVGAVLMITEFMCVISSLLLFFLQAFLGNVYDHQLAASSPCDVDSCPGGVSFGPIDALLQRKSGGAVVYLLLWTGMICFLAGLFFGAVLFLGSAALDNDDLIGLWRACIAMGWFWALYVCGYVFTILGLLAASFTTLPTLYAAIASGILFVVQFPLNNIAGRYFLIGWSSATGTGWLHWNWVWKQCVVGPMLVGRGRGLEIAGGALERWARLEGLRTLKRAEEGLLPEDMASIVLEAAREARKVE